MARDGEELDEQSAAEDADVVEVDQKTWSKAMPPMFQK